MYAIKRRSIPKNTTKAIIVPNMHITYVIVWCIYGMHIDLYRIQADNNPWHSYYIRDCIVCTWHSYRFIPN